MSELQSRRELLQDRGVSTRSDPRELERQRILYNSLATGGGRIDKSDHSYRSSTMHKRLSGHVEQEVQGLDDPTLRTHTTACEEACSEQRRVHGIPERESWVSSVQERDWSIDKSYLRNATIMSSTITYITILISTYITISIYIVIVGDVGEEH